MPKFRANDCEMHYEVDDYTDPWLKQTVTVWLQHGVGRSSRFWYRWVPAPAGHYRVCAVTCVASARDVLRSIEHLDRNVFEQFFFGGKLPPFHISGVVDNLWIASFSPDRRECRRYRFLGDQVELDNHSVAVLPLDRLR